MYRYSNITKEEKANLPKEYLADGFRDSYNYQTNQIIRRNKKN